MKFGEGLIYFMNHRGLCANRVQPIEKIIPHAGLRGHTAAAMRGNLYESFDEGLFDGIGQTSG